MRNSPATAGLASFFLTSAASRCRHTLEHVVRCRDPGRGGVAMWVKPEFKIIEICAEVTAYAYRK